MEKLNVKLYTDGAARGNPDGPGGYGIVLQYTGEDGEMREVEYSAGFPKTTNNRMELMAVIVGIETINAIKTLYEFSRESDVHVISDSQYVTNAFNKDWLANWKKNGWKTANNKPVKNLDLWQRLLKALKSNNVTFEWVRGHNGDPMNERCDKLATEAADKMKGE